jgi:hypothetical protein
MQMKESFFEEHFLEKKWQLDFFNTVKKLIMIKNENYYAFILCKNYLASFGLGVIYYFLRSELLSIREHGWGWGDGGEATTYLG